MELNCVFLGAGNLATNLALALKAGGINIVQVYSRTEKSARTLAVKLKTGFTTHITGVTKNADVYFIALKDIAFHEVLSKADFHNGLLVHCSGSQPISVLEGYAENTGVLYPLQTFSRNRIVDFEKIPVFIEANKPENEKLLCDLASKITKNVSVLNSDKRILLHIAAVFACNFVNHFYGIAGSILDTAGISFDVLRPLIMETAQKVQEITPGEAQTGPAVRFDKTIIERHLQMLESGNKIYFELYKMVSASIFEHHKKITGL